MPGTEILKPVEELGVRIAQLAGVSRLPVIGSALGRYADREAIREQQLRLQPFAGHVVVVGGNFTENVDGDKQPPPPEEVADRTSRLLFEQQILAIGEPLVIRAILSDGEAHDTEVEASAQLMVEAVERNYGIEPYFVPEPKTISPGQYEEEPLPSRTHRTIDEAIRELRTGHIAGSRGAVPYLDPHLTLLFVAPDMLASDALPPSISHNDMSTGGTALLTDVGPTPGQNVWLPEHGS